MFILYPGQSSNLRLVLFMFALCSGRCLGVKILCFVSLGQSQWAEVLCYCHPGPEGSVHPSAHVGSSKRMGKALSSYGYLGIVYQGPSSIAQEYLLVSGPEWSFVVWLMCPHPSCLLSNYCTPHPG